MFGMSRRTWFPELTTLPFASTTFTTSVNGLPAVAVEALLVVSNASPVAAPATNVI